MQITQYTREEHEAFTTELMERLFKKYKQDFQPQKKTYWLTRKEVCQRLSVSYVTLNNWSHKGILIGYKVGNRVRYKSEQVEAALVKMG